MGAGADSRDGPLGAEQDATRTARIYAIVNEELHDDVFGSVTFAKGQILSLVLPSCAVLSDALVG